MYGSQERPKGSSSPEESPIFERKPVRKLQDAAAGVGNSGGTGGLFAAAPPCPGWKVCLRIRPLARQMRALSGGVSWVLGHFECLGVSLDFAAPRSAWDVFTMHFHQDGRLTCGAPASNDCDGRLRRLSERPDLRLKRQV